MAALSRQELAVVNALANGLNQKEIGCSMGITAKTVQAYVLRARAKYQAKNTSHLVALAVSNGQVLVS